MRRLGALLCVLLWSVAASALSRVDSVRVDVLLHDDGSASVTEVWTIDVGGDITEWYLGKENLGKMRISGLSVTDEYGTAYVNEGTGWNIHRSRAAKAGRCGIVTKDGGCEICWGIGSFGTHTYSVSYLLSGLVQGYSDEDGFNFMFVTQTDGGAKSVSLSIRKEGTILTADNTRVWGFGFNGECDVIGGAARYWSTSFSESSSLIAMVAFDKGMFNPSIVNDKSFGEVKDEAFKGSDYSKPKTGFMDVLTGLLMMLLCILPFLAVMIVPIWKLVGDRRRKKALLGGRMKDVEWFRDVPVGGDLRKASNILRIFSGKTMVENQNLIAAYMMRLFYDGAFELVPQASGTPSFKINDIPVKADAVQDMDSALEQELFGFFKEAAGDDSILQKKELKKWAGKNGNRIYAWQSKVPGNYSLKTLDPVDVRQVFGLRKFLKDFTLIHDRGAVEVKLWNNYLIFASLYGIADQVYKDFKKVCPEYFTLSQALDQGKEITPVVLWNTFGDTSRYFNQSGLNYAARQRSSSGGTRWSGGGGMTSFGGGGGFSGGGHSGGR